MAKNVRILFMDVDGTLTDGKLNVGENGEVFKAFDVKDGCGIHDMLPAHGIIPVIITGRVSGIVERRAAELGIEELYQGKKDKVKTLYHVLEKYGCTVDEAAYIGDDLPDLPCMELCGVAGCPSDAVKAIRDKCEYVCRAQGGCGAVREFIEWLIQPDRG